MRLIFAFGKIRIINQRKYEIKRKEIKRTISKIDKREENLYNFLMSIFDGKMNLSVTSASGIEAVTKRELESLGYEAGPAVFGRIGFNGDMTALARANMFLRTANHVYVNLFSFKA